MDFFPIAWACIIAFCIVMYIILDGFTLGAGMMMPLLDKDERDIAYSVLLPTWDGNQTWLVLGGASLYGAFPAAFSLLMPAFYIPLIIMVIALLFRGVVFEFRLKATHGRKHWDWVFAASSLLVTIIQGIVLGNMAEGFEIGTNGDTHSLGSIINPFTLFTAFGLIVGYCLLGSTRLILKTEGSTHDKMYKVAYITAFTIMFCFGGVSLWTPFINDFIFNRWFMNDNWILLLILPYITIIAFSILLYSLYKKDEVIPFWASVVLLLCSYIGFGVSIYPYIVPFQLTIWEAAAPTKTLKFLLVGAIIMLPLLIMYTTYSYHIFRGKVKNVIHY